MAANRILTIYLSAIEKLICRGEISSRGSSTFGFSQNTTNDFLIEFIVALSSTNATK